MIMIKMILMKIKVMIENVFNKYKNINKGEYNNNFKNINNKCIK